MKKVELMNTAIVRRQAFYMERDENDVIGTDSPTEIRDDGCDGYVMYAEDVYNFANEAERRDMFMRMINGAASTGECPAAVCCRLVAELEKRENNR